MKITASETIYYTPGGGEYSSVTGWKKLHVYLGREKLVEYSAGVTWFFHADHLGTPKVRTTHQGAVAEIWDYYPFGETWVSGLPGDQHCYTGHLRDTESNNDYAGARYYSNVRGRWLSADPALGDLSNPQRLNRYAYVAGDPVNNYDPSGADPVFRYCQAEMFEMLEFSFYYVVCQQGAGRYCQELCMGL